MNRLIWSFVMAFGAMMPVAFGACTLPDGLEGEMVYNRTHKIVQYCDGAQWIAASVRAGGENGSVQFKGDGKKLLGGGSLIWDTDNARLGIGTTPPESTIHLSSNPATDAIRITGQHADYFFRFNVPGSAVTNEHQYLLLFRTTNDDKRMRIDGIFTAYRDLASSTYGADIMQVAAGSGVNGAMGASMNILGTRPGGSNPHRFVTLTYQGEKYLAIQRFNTSHWGWNAIAFQGATTNLQDFRLVGAADVSGVAAYTDFGYYMLNSGTMFIAVSGQNLGIGTTSPSYKLHVAGRIAGAGAYANASDMRLKTHIRDIDYGADTLLRLRPVGFEWVKQAQEWQMGPQIGLIAQEVEKIVPEVVSTADDEAGTKSIAYTDLVPVLIKTFQDQQAQIRVLEAEIDALRR